MIEAGRALIVVANKWDLVEEKDDTYADLSAHHEAVRHRSGHARLSA